MAEQSFQIFISYRRSDTAAYAGRIYDRLKATYGHDSVFMDITHIELGMDFTVGVRRAIESCDLFLCLIGRDWLKTEDAEGGRRLDNPADHVRIEIEAALARDDIRLLPLLFEGAQMPDPKDLPSALAPIALRNALEISDKRWDYDFSQLTDFIDRLKAANAPADATPDVVPKPQQIAESPSGGVPAGVAIANQLRALGVRGILPQAAEQGYIPEFACSMPECFCPAELGGRSYFEPSGTDLTDWMATVDHFPILKEQGGHKTVDNVRPGHRLCNRVDYAKRSGRTYAKDLQGPRPRDGLPSTTSELVCLGQSHRLTATTRRPPHGVFTRDCFLSLSDERRPLFFRSLLRDEVLDIYKLLGRQLVGAGDRVVLFRLEPSHCRTNRCPRQPEDVYVHEPEALEERADRTYELQDQYDNTPEPSSLLVPRRLTRVPIALVSDAASGVGLLPYLERSSSQRLHRAGRLGGHPSGLRAERVEARQHVSDQL